MVRFNSLLLFPLGLTSATTSNQENVYKLIVGMPYQFKNVAFDSGTFFQQSISNGSAAPTWMLWNSPDLLYVNDENSPVMRIFKLDPADARLPTKATVEAEGSWGIVSMAFTKDHTRMVGASYSNGTADIWDTSNGGLKLLKNITFEGPVGTHPSQTQHRAHQAIRDPSDRYFVVTDLGGDAINIIDSKDDKFDVAGQVFTSPGSGPRHGRFFKDGDKTYYAVACELDNKVRLWNVQYNEDGSMNTKWEFLQEASTYGTGKPVNATTAAAGEIQVTSDNHIYVSNRLSGAETDSIAHFTFDASNKDGPLVFAETVDSMGQVPRMFSLSFDEKYLFSTNQQGVSKTNPDANRGLIAFQRGEKGELKHAASLPVAVLAQDGKSDTGFGPQFVRQIA